ncbi:hypothetical protein F4778DRAFT_775381 [Xylariomycetidae sp. FL2044]|nr:hypothetical protein F4778DRAFT_775381 [Xylariomycetidae sp. FL2044]
MAHTAYGAADIGECLLRRAECALETAEAAKSDVSVRDALFRAATYFRAADF